MWPVVVFALLVGASTAPIEETASKKNVQPLTVEAFDSYLGMLQMFKGVLPPDMVQMAQNLNLTQKNEMITMLSEWYTGKIKRPETKAELVELVKEKLPTVYEKIAALNESFYNKFNALKPESQAMLREWKAKALDLHGDTAAESAAKQIQLFKDFGLSVQNMPADIKEDLRTQFPSAVNMLDGFGFTIITTFAMIAQKIVESFHPVATAASAAAECAIPLD